MILFAFFLFSCNNDKKEQDQFYKEVMDIHDEVMPQMYPLRKLVKDLKVQADLVLIDSIEVDSVRLDLIKEAAVKATKANESMMDWMHQFKQIKEGTPHKEVIKYLLDQKQKISKVREDMLTAKKEAEKYISIQD